MVYKSLLLFRTSFKNIVFAQDNNNMFQLQQKYYVMETKSRVLTVTSIIKLNNKSQI